ncbi:MAG: spore germination protein [Pelosinus sp.]|nr:spore germination protein [Pelosinus sp.]
MANLESKNKMSVIQLAIVTASTCIGSQLIIGINKLVTEGGHLTWLSIILGGLLYYLVTLLMIKLGNEYPDQTLVSYMPELWGSFLGNIVIWWFALLFLLQIATILTGVRKAIVFFMFTRTPPEVLALGLLTVCVYCALQDWGTLLRIQQFIFFVATPVFALLLLVSLFNFNPENLLPFLPKKDIPKLLPTMLEGWNMFSGYEIILFLFPLTYHCQVSIAKALGGAFGCMTVAFLACIVIAIGVLTVNGVTSTLYPIMTAMSSVELPGTFLERLETYLVVFWIPVVFDTLAIFLWIPAQVLMQKKQYTDHRPWVLLFAPLIYFAGNILDSLKALDTADKVVTWLGLGFSLGVIPLSLLLLLWKNRGDKTCQK